MIVIAGKLHERTLENHERDRKYQEQKRIRDTAIKKYEDEQNKVNKLMSDMSKWNRSVHLRSYVEAVKENHTKEHGAIEDGSDMAKWLKWAYDQADRLDPLMESPPSILDKPKPTPYW